MAELLIGTDEGVLRLRDDGKTIEREDGPQRVAFLARAYAGVFAVTRESALWKRTKPDSWRLVNERPVQEGIWAFAADPRVPGRLYLGVSPALLYISDDDGRSWVACDAIKRIPGYERWTFPPPPHIAHVRSVAPDPRVAGAVYIGVEEGGVYRSDDGGETWESLNDGLYWDVHTIVPDPEGVRLYATTGTGFHRSDDGGRHWRHLMTGLDRSYTVPCAVSPKRTGLLYTAAAATPPPGWGRGANAALYRSEDGGEHWSRLERGLPPRFDVMVRQIVVDAAGTVYAASGPMLFISGDEGETWRQVTADLPPVQALATV